MILVTGGSSQGKREFVRQYLGGQDTEPVVWTEGAEASWEEFMEGSVVPCGHEPEGPVTEQLLEELFAGPEDRVLVTDETGCGIVPADAFERLYREETGRLCCRIAGEAEEVWRVCCGIGMRIK